MSGQLVEFRLEDGGYVIVEVDEQRGGVKPASPKDKITEAEITFEEALDKVRPAAEAIIRKLRTGISIPPDEVEVEFGLKLNAKAGAYIAQAGIEANYKVTLKWQKVESSDEQSP